MTRDFPFNHAADGCRPSVRLGLIGLGRRGLATLRRYALLPCVAVEAICDLIPAALDAGRAEVACRRSDAPLRCYSDWATMLAAEADLGRLDAVVVCTDWASHTPIALEALRQGHNVAVEVPLATTLEQCAMLLECESQSRGWLTMMENCCYDPFNLFSVELIRRGLLGRVSHIEGAYIHDLRTECSGARSWYIEQGIANGANPYPTHAAGPAFNLADEAARLRGQMADPPVRLVSMSSRLGEPGCGPNTTLVETAAGVTIMLQYDVATPRPYSRLQSVCATHGYVSKYPLEIARIDSLNGGADITGDALADVMHTYRHPWLELYEADGIAAATPNMMNYIMDRRLVDAIVAGRRPDISAAQAALWSSLADLTRMSVAAGSAPVDIPAWLTAAT